MYTDVNMRVSVAQDISAVVSTIVSTDSIDLAPSTIGGNQAPDIGSGMKIRAAFTITEAVVGTVSTVQFQIITDSTADLATTPLVIGTTLAILTIIRFAIGSAVSRTSGTAPITFGIHVYHAARVDGDGPRGPEDHSRLDPGASRRPGRTRHRR